VRESLELLIRFAGWRPETYASAHEFLARPLADVPSCLVLDVSMPGQDGFETSRRLRADPRTSYLPVVFLTARTRETDVATGYERGGDGYVTKPFEPKELLARVDALVGVGRMRALAEESS
jgi:two-component system OmpR family response regulator